MTEIANDIDTVRAIMGGWADGRTDESIINPVSLTTTWASLTRRCPSLIDSIDPVVIAQADDAQAYLLASFAMYTQGPQVTSSRLGDQATTFANSDASSNDAAREWRRIGFSIMDESCPSGIVKKAFGAGFFAIARGRRGE